VLCDALEAFGSVDVLTHAIRLPAWNETVTDARRLITVGVQPLTVHGEAALSGRLFRGRLRAANYDLIWSVNSRYAGMPRYAGVPYLVWEATPIRDEMRASSVREVRRAGRGSGIGLMAHRVSLGIGERLERRALAGATKVYAMSEYTRARVLAIHHLPSSHVNVLLHPPTRGYLDALKRRGGVSARAQRHIDATPRLLFVGRADDPRKNLSLLFDACRLLDGNGFPVHLTVVGPHTDRWARGRLFAPNVDLLGSVDIDRLVEVYLSHDVLVLSSRQEGFGIVIAEALHAALPIVTTPCGGPEDVLRRSEGGVVAGNTAEELAGAIRALVANQGAWHRASRKGMQFAATELSFARLTANVRAILRQVIADDRLTRESILATTAAG